MVLLVLAAKVAVAFAYTVLSAVHNPLYASIMSFYAHLFAVCPRSHYEVWAFQRAETGCLAPVAVQPLGGKRI